MKILRPVAFFAAALFAWEARAQDEIYYYSGPISGGVQAALGSVGLNSSGFFWSDFGTIHETFDFNPLTRTLQQSGEITLLNPTGTFSMNGHPNPIGTATLTVGDGGVIPFNVTAQQGGSPQYYNAVIDVPVSGFGTNQGQPFSGNWQLDLGVQTQLLSSNANSVAFSQYQDYGLHGTEESIVVDGLADGVEGAFSYYWGVNGAAVATPVPDGASAWTDAGMTATILAMGSVTYIRRTSARRLIY